MDPVLSASKLTVGKLIEEMSSVLGIRSLSGATGLSTNLKSPDISRPGMALTGYTHKFQHLRIQIFGETEITYLTTLSSSDRISALRNVFDFPIICSLVTKGLTPPDELVEISSDSASALLVSPRDTTPLIHDLTDYLEEIFAPRDSTFGTLVDVYGAGVLCTGRSAIGKSEAVLGLLDKGHRLVADDRVYIRRIRGNLFGAGDTEHRHLMEIRGLGFIDVENMFGIRSTKERQQIHIEVRLLEWGRDTKNIDRIGIDRKTKGILGTEIPYIELPVIPGRNLALLLETAAVNALLDMRGISIPEQVESRLIERNKRNAGKNGKDGSL